MSIDDPLGHLRSSLDGGQYEDEDDWDDDDDDWDDEDDDEDDDDDDDDYDDDDDEDDDWEDDDDDWEDGSKEGDRHDNNTGRLMEALQRLSFHFPLCVNDDHKFVVVGGVRLPPGYNRDHTPLLIELPADFPCSPPGIAGRRVFVPPDLRFRGRRLADIHPGTTPRFSTPGFGPWAWLCYEAINWNPLKDNLITFIEMVRADLTNPETV